MVSLLHFFLVLTLSIPSNNIDPDRLIDNTINCPDIEVIDSKAYNELFNLNQPNENMDLSACWEGGEGWLCESKGCWQMTDVFCGKQCVTKNGCSVCFICTGNLTPPTEPIVN